MRLVDQQLAEVTTALDSKTTVQVFRAGDPIDRAGEAFVPRMSVQGEIERQIMLATECPGIILYGRRRMGKSTILRTWCTTFRRPFKLRS